MRVSKVEEVDTMSEYLNANEIKRISLISDFMEKYLVSKDKVTLYREYEKVLKTVQPLDLFHLPLFSDKSRLTNDEIMSYANRFVNLFFHGLTAFEWNRKVSVLLELLMAENQAILAELNAVKPYFENDKIEVSVDVILGFFHKIEAIDKKFIKSQMIIYPALEKVLPSGRPFQILWRVEDEIMIERKLVIDLLTSEVIDWVNVKIAIGQFYYQLAGLIQKEELIILPLASEFIKNTDWDTMLIAANTIGYTFIKNPVTEDKTKTSADNQFDRLLIKTQTGELSIEQFSLVMSYLPISITFVDEFNRVRYYNQTKERHFPRTPQSIGREVKNCHPEKSIQIVEKIIEAFRANRQSIAQFWMTFKDKKLLISYYAVRNSMNEYKGVLEVTQDITLMRAYDGEKRLLDWE